MVASIWGALSFGGVEFGTSGVSSPSGASRINNLSEVDGVDNAFGAKPTQTLNRRLSSEVGSEAVGI